MWYLSVEANSNAANARLQKGDIIWSVGRTEIKNLSEFKSVIKDKDILVLRVNRKGTSANNSDEKIK